MASNNLNSFLDKLRFENKKPGESFEVLDEESKDLAKEDALALIAEFVKDVKKKFENRDDQIEILRDASKTLEFYINEVVNSEPKSSTTISFGSAGADSDSDSLDSEDFSNF